MRNDFIYEIWLQGLTADTLPEPYKEIASIIGFANSKKLFALEGRIIFVNTSNKTNEAGSPQDDIRKVIGENSFTKLQAVFKNTYIYFTKLDDMIAKERDKLIFEGFNGYNYGELAQKFNLSEMRIRQIIEKIKKGDTSKTQISFFDYGIN